jgi:hypothetical protein
MGLWGKDFVGSVGECVGEDGKFGWYLPEMACDLPTGFVMVNGRDMLRFEAGDGWDNAIEKGASITVSAACGHSA